MSLLQQSNFTYSENYTCVRESIFQICIYFKQKLRLWGNRMHVPCDGTDFIFAVTPTLGTNKFQNLQHGSRTKNIVHLHQKSIMFFYNFPWYSYLSDHAHLSTCTHTSSSTVSPQLTAYRISKTHCIKQFCVNTSGINCVTHISPF